MDLPWKVAQGKRRRRKNTKSSYHSIKFKCTAENDRKHDKEEVTFTPANYLKSISNISTELMNCPVTRVLFNEVLLTRIKQRTLETCESETLFEVICYGLGSPTNSKNSLYQLTLLVMLRKLFCHIQSDESGIATNDYFLKENDHFSDLSLSYIFDPVFSEDDHILLEKLGFTVLKINEEARRQSNASISLFYMIHCTAEMYENLLQANWEPDKLSSIILVGNSISSMYETMQLQDPGNDLEKTHPCLHKCYTFKLNSEIKINEWKERSTVFNDTALTYFSFRSYSFPQKRP